MQGDDTNGHIDNLARFVNPTNMVCVVEEDENDPNYPCFKKNFDLILILHHAIRIHYYHLRLHFVSIA